MPKVNWGVSSGDVDAFDRDSQFKPYAGPAVPNGVYRMRVKSAKRIAAAQGKYPQLRLGLELVPRNAAERKFSDYFIMAFLPVMNKTQFRYVPFLDAIGVSATDFTARTVADEEGDIKRIGQWKNDGNTLIMVQLKSGEDDKGNPRQDVGTFLANVESDDDEDIDEDEDAYDDEEIDETDYVDDEDEEEADEFEEEEDGEEGEEGEGEEYEDEPEPIPAPKRRTAPTSRAAKPATSTFRRRRAAEDEDAF